MRLLHEMRKFHEISLSRVSVCSDTPIYHDIMLCVLVINSTCKDKEIQATMILQTYKKQTGK